MFVVAIDVGIKNLGLCVYDFTTSKVVHWDTVSLTNGRYIPALNVQYVLKFVAKYAVFFEQAVTIVIERQMRCNMRIIEAILETLFYDRCRVIHARSIKAHYKLSTRNYRANKQKAVEWAEAFVNANPSAFTCADVFRQSAKRDDLADSLLLVMYYLDTYSNQLE